MTWRRHVWDNIIRLAFAVIVLDWVFVSWRTFIWLDLAAWAAMAWASEASEREDRREAARHLTLDDVRPPAHDADRADPHPSARTLHHP